MSEKDASQSKEKTADDDPIGACRFTNASGRVVCIDEMKKSECDQIQNSVFIEGGSCQ